MKCAIVDAYGIGRFLPAALRRYGVEPLHVRSQFPDVHLSYEAGRLRDRHPALRRLGGHCRPAT